MNCLCSNETLDCNTAHQLFLDLLLCIECSPNDKTCVNPTKFKLSEKMVKVYAGEVLLLEYERETEELTTFFFDLYAVYSNKLEYTINVIVESLYTYSGREFREYLQILSCNGIEIE